MRSVQPTYACVIGRGESVKNILLNREEICRVKIIFKKNTIVIVTHYAVVMNRIVRWCSCIRSHNKWVNRFHLGMYIKATMDLELNDVAYRMDEPDLIGITSTRVMLSGILSHYSTGGDRVVRTAYDANSLPWTML